MSWRDIMGKEKKQSHLCIHTYAINPTCYHMTQPRKSIVIIRALNALVIQIHIKKNARCSFIPFFSQQSFMTHTPIHVSNETKKKRKNNDTVCKKSCGPKSKTLSPFDINHAISFFFFFFFFFNQTS